MSNTTYGAIKLATAEDVGAVLKKKMGTVNGYKPKEWADTINLMGLLPIRTASGTIAHFEDGADDVPLKSLTATITPKQEGTGDPSPTNPRPISGTSELTLNHKGKNLLDVKPYADWEAVANSYFGLRNCIPSGRRMIMTFTDKDTSVDVSGCYLGFFDSSYTSGNLGQNQYRWCLSDGVVSQYRQNYPVNNDTTIYLDSVFIYPKTEETYNKIFTRYNVQIELGTTSTTYEPYTGTTYTVDLGQTVYAGELDVTTGEGSITHQMYDMSALSWNKNGSTPTFYSGIIQGITEQTADFYCTCYLPTVNGGYNAQNWKCSLRGETGQTRIWVCDNRFETSADFRASLTNQKIVLPKATPTEIALTPEEVNTFYGANNIWADTGDTEVEYRADIDLLLESLQGNRGLQMLRATPTEETEQTEEVEENEDER